MTLCVFSFMCVCLWVRVSVCVSMFHSCVVVVYPCTRTVHRNVLRMVTRYSLRHSVCVLILFGMEAFGAAISWHIIMATLGYCVRSRESCAMIHMHANSTYKTAYTDSHRTHSNADCFSKLTLIMMINGNHSKDAF